MGTRADFYVGRGKSAEWIGSIAFDGNPEGIDAEVLNATTPEQYREAVAEFFAERDDSTTPARGWPWPWEDSRTSDYAYAFDDGRVWASPFGHGWIAPNAPQEEWEKLPESKVEFPDMTDKMSVALGKQSGMILLRGGEIIE